MIRKLQENSRYNTPHQTQALEDESLLIASQIINNDIIDEVLECGILPQDFGDEAAMLCQEAIYFQYRHLGEVCINAVEADLISTLGRDAAGDMLGEWLNDCLIWFHWRWHATRVAQAAYNRSLHFAYAEGLADLRDTTMDNAGIESRRALREQARQATFARLGGLL